MHLSEAEKITATKKMVILEKENPGQAEQEASQHDLIECVPDIAGYSCAPGARGRSQRTKKSAYRIAACPANPIQQSILD